MVRVSTGTASESLSPSLGAGVRFDQFVEATGYLASKVGRGLAAGRRWVEAEGLEKYPLATLGIAFTLGVFTGWFVKRR